jgi:hypothetical protein
MLARKICVVLLASTLLPGSVQTVNAQSDAWTTNGPEGGTITTLASDPRAPATLYAGTWNDGVFKSIDGGGRWINLGCRTRVSTLWPSILRHPTRSTRARTTAASSRAPMVESVGTPSTRD